MHSEVTNISPTKVKIFIKADKNELDKYKKITLQKLAKTFKAAGFREGKAPLTVVEKNIDQGKLQTDFIEEAMSGLYAEAAKKASFRPVAKPDVAVKKFVPFSDLEYEVTVDIVGKVKLTNYKAIKLPKSKVQISSKDIDDVINSLRNRVAEKNEVDKAAEKTDEILIDFKGVDAKDKPINGADGNDYPLMLGSSTFIPGFEENLIGVKKGDEMTFTVTFPKDYGVETLANKRVKFTVNVKKVQEVTLPKVDDAFASKVGPLKTLKDLKADIKKQLEIERQNELNRNYANELVQKITDKSEVAVPETMVTHQMDHNLSDFKRNLTYRGQTYEEFLSSEGITEDQHRKDILEPEVRKQVKGSLVLAEISEQEKIYVTPEELDLRVQMLKGQYKDEKMIENLDKPESRNDITSRLITEKVLTKLEEYANN